MNLRNLSRWLAMCVLLCAAQPGAPAAAARGGTAEAIQPKSQSNTYRAAGTVLDEKGEPVIGATVMEKGTHNGTSTDVDGRFSLDVRHGATLVISSIGCLTQEVVAGSSLSVRLKDDSKILDDVVVVGYGVQKKKLVTGATVQVKGEDISKLHTTDVLGALQSQAPGVNITTNNGFLGGGFKVAIRGLGSYSGSSPFVVVDGVPNASIDNLNPSDIESIDVLKDAASAAIYGSRASNGVILVTTKHGHNGEASISYDGYIGWQNLYKIPTLLTAKEYMQIEDEGRVMDGLDPYDWSVFIPARDLNYISRGVWNGTNWLKEIENKDAIVQNHAVNVTGGSDRGSYALGFSYQRQESTLGVPKKFPYLSRYNFRVNNDYVVKRLNGHDFIKVGETLNYRYSNMKGSFGTGGIYWNALHNMLVMSPLMHAYNDNGEYYVYRDRVADGYNWDISNNADANPIAYMDYYMNQNQSRSHYIQASAYAEIQPVNGLKFRSQFNYTYSQSDYRSYLPTFKLTATLNNTTDRASQSKNDADHWAWENTLTYDFKLGEHAFETLLGQSCEKSGWGSSLSVSANDLNFDEFKYAYISNTQVNANHNNLYSASGAPNTPSAMASFFGRVNWNWKERYLATFILRSDGSSVFARGHRWHTYPSFSAGWIVTNEDFARNNGIVDFFKLRASYGINGNNSVSPFQYLSLITTNDGYGGYTFGDAMNTKSQGSYAYQVVNPNLTWEKNRSFDLGFDARFLANRLAAEFDFYVRTTSDLLVTAPILASVGANAPAINGGKVQNRGIELALHWNDLVGRDFYYGINWNIAYNKNKVKEINNADGIIHGAGSILWEGCDEVIRTAEVGKPMGYFYGYKTAGVFQNQAQIDAYQGPKMNAASTQPGDLIFVDNNGDGVIDTKDRTMIGDPHPDVTMGLSFNLGWKAVDLEVTTYGAFGQQILKNYRNYSSSPLQNYTTDVFKRWHGEGTSNKYPRLSAASTNNWNTVSDMYVENGDYLKIKNVTLGYDFKKTFTKLPFQQLRLYFQVQNLFTFTGYSGMDPEVGYGGDSYTNITQGIDLGYYPTSRNFLVGVNVKF